MGKIKKISGFPQSNKQEIERLTIQEHSKNRGRDKSKKSSFFHVGLMMSRIEFCVT